MWKVFFILVLILLTLPLWILSEEIHTNLQDLDENFLNDRFEGHWLVLFYVPWCAHCQAVKPTFSAAAEELRSTDIKVGKMDCIKNRGMGEKFELIGYPTIKYFKDDKVYHYEGERTKKAIIRFAKRLREPSVEMVIDSKIIEYLKEVRMVFFLFIGSPEGVAWSTYKNVARDNQEHSFFYASNEEIAKNHFNLTSIEIPALLVFKDQTSYFFPNTPFAQTMDLSDLQDSMQQWVHQERFIAFPKVTAFNITQFMRIDKYLLMAVINETNLEEQESAAYLLEMIENFIKNNWETYHKKYQFGWIGDPFLVQSIIYQIISTPNLLVIDPTKQHHYLPQDKPSDMTAKDFEIFLDMVQNDEALPFGSRDSFSFILAKNWYHLTKFAFEMWKVSPLITTIVFSTPIILFLLSIISLIQSPYFRGFKETDSASKHKNKDEKKYEKCDNPEVEEIIDILKQNGRVQEKTKTAQDLRDVNPNGLKKKVPKRKKKKDLCDQEINDIGGHIKEE